MNNKQPIDPTFVVDREAVAHEIKKGLRSLLPNDCAAAAETPSEENGQGTDDAEPQTMAQH